MRLLPRHSGWSNLPRRLPLRLLSSFLLVATLRAADEPASSAPPAVTNDYRIANHDLIQFQVYEEPDVAVIQRVSASGEIRLPLIGTVSLAGLTLREAESRLRERFIGGGFYVNPQIILSLQEYTERSVSVLGQVNKPDQVQLAPEAESIGLAQAITYAGGLTRLAKADAIQVVRTATDGREKRFVVDLNAYLGHRNGAASQFELQPGDIVFVPERVF